MKTKNIFLFLVLTFSISSNTFVCADQFKNSRLKDIEDKVSESNQYAEVKRNVAIAGAFLSSVTALGSWTYCLKRKSDAVSKDREGFKQEKAALTKLKNCDDAKEAKRLRDIVTSVDGPKMKELVEIFKDQVADGVKLDVLTLEKLLDIEKKTDKSNSKKDAENILFKIVEGVGGLKSFTSDMGKLRGVRDTKMASMNLSIEEINVVNRVLGEVLVQLVQVQSQDVLQSLDVKAGEPEKKQPTSVEVVPEVNTEVTKKQVSKD